MTEKNQPVSLLSVSSSDVLPAFLPFPFYAYQSVLLSLFIYFIRKGGDVVQFHILILSRPISSHPFFNTSCYLVFKQKVTLHLHGNSSYNRIYCFLHYSQQNKSFSLHFIDLLPDSM